MTRELLSVRVPRALHARLAAYAEEREVALSAAARQLLADGLDRQTLAQDITAATRDAVTREVRSAIASQRDELVRVVAYATASAVAIGQRLPQEDARAIADAIRAGLAQYQSEGR